MLPRGCLGGLATLPSRNTESLAENKEFVIKTLREEAERRGLLWTDIESRAVSMDILEFRRQVSVTERLLTHRPR